MSKVPGNSNFEGRLTYLQLVKTYMTPVSYRCVFATYIFWTMGMNVSSIVMSAQVFDNVLLTSGKACALELAPRFAHHVCISAAESDTEDSIFGDAWVVSVGYLVLAFVTIPFGFLDLSENISYQCVTFVGLLIVYFIWCGYFLSLDIDFSQLPAIGESGNALGFVLFNFAFVVITPEWINEKSSEVDIPKSLAIAVTLGGLLLMVPAALAALTLDFTGGEDLLAQLTRPSIPAFIKISTFFFPLFEFVVSIPILSVIVRYNLVESGVASRPTAAFIAVVLPWLMGICFYGGIMINYVITWVGISAAGPLNFIIPCWIFLISSRSKRLVPSVIEEEGGQYEEEKKRSSLRP